MTSSVRSVRGTLRNHALVLGAALLVLWIFFAASLISRDAILALGVIPRTAIGLRGILFAPFLHANLSHLVANSFAFLVLGWLVMLRDDRHFVSVTLIAMLGSGLMAWLIGAPQSVHVGASGVIFGYLGFLILSGWYARSVASIVLSILVTVFWGGLVLGVMPGQAGISWQAHLGGFLAGALAARAFNVRAVAVRSF